MMAKAWYVMVKRMDDLRWLTMIIWVAIIIPNSILANIILAPLSAIIKYFQLLFTVTTNHFQLVSIINQPPLTTAYMAMILHDL